MSKLGSLLVKIKSECTLGYWGERMWAQLAYAEQFSKVANHQYHDVLTPVAEKLWRTYSENKVITKEDVLQMEDSLSTLNFVAKQYTMACVAHAHIDMNWMWRWDETVSVTLDTFRTMLDLMAEFPEFTFAQSQAAIYRIVEEHAPDMLNEIRKRVQEGRWEVTASHWVEADKNMSGGESLSRQILYTKQYLSELLGIDPDTLNIDFEPDTFGHSANVPEILRQGGVKYYYHCRGYDGHNLYRWVAPSGASVISFREPVWYNAWISPDMVLHVPEFCHEHCLTSVLKVYGVGDHGGGPTRRDLHRLLDMKSWPIFPTLTFGTFRDFYAKLETIASQLPVVNGELNAVFTGCYTSQTRIKKANRVSESVLFDAEAISTLNHILTNGTYDASLFGSAWKNVLFNQFHDILPGSGVTDTREYAMGLFQQTMAKANTMRTMAMRSIASAVNTTDLVPDETVTEQGLLADGAGVGFGIEGNRPFQTARGKGKTRVFHVFNTLPYARCETAELILWDWPGDVKLLKVIDDKKRPVRHQVLEKGVHDFDNYWGHTYIRLLIPAVVPASGYQTYVVLESDDYEGKVEYPIDHRVEREDVLVLENQFVKVAFDSRTGALTSMVNRATGCDLVSNRGVGGVFQFVREDESRGMTSWITGRHIDTQPLTKNVRIQKKSGTIRQSIVMEMEFGASRMIVHVNLDDNSPILSYSIECDWREFGGKGRGVPQLSYLVPLNYECRRYLYDVPFGVVERQERDNDLPASSFSVAIHEKYPTNSLMLCSDSRHGFRGHDGTLGITIIRSSFDPDPYPEIGEHRMQFSISPVDAGNRLAQVTRSQQIHHPMNVIASNPSLGHLEAQGSFFEVVQGTAIVCAIKMPEDGPKNTCVVRMYEVNGTPSEVVLWFGHKIRRAAMVDIREVPNEGTLRAADDTVTFWLEPYQMRSIVVQFE